MSTEALPSDSLVYGAALRDRVLASFSSDVRPVDVPPLYRLGLFCVALTMVLLPLVYLALVGAAGWGVYYHATEHLSWFKVIESPKLAAVAYVGPLIVGGLLFIFLLKPIFVRQAKSKDPTQLRRQDEPLLFAYVERVCAAVGAPVPRQILVDCEVNASARFRRGLVSFFGDDLVLTLGVPLVNGLSLQQLTGVLAHEFGHFAQGAGMRLTFIVRSINHWFYRVAYERDRLDVMLDQQLKESEHWIAQLVVWAAKHLIHLSRLVLVGLMKVGHAISCFMMRQMEFDADRYEARMVGSSTFEATCRDLRILGFAYQRSLESLSEAWREKRLADSLPGLVALHHARLEPDVRVQLDRLVDEVETGMFDTHPADRDRIASARREGADGVFASDLPATVVFRDFGGLARRISLEFYADVLGHEVAPESLQAVEAMAARQQLAERDLAACGRFFQAIVHGARRLPFGAPELEREVSDVGALANRLEAGRAAILARAPSYRRALARFFELDEGRIELAKARRLAELEVTFDAKSFGLADQKLGTVLDALAARDAELSAIESELAGVETLAAERLHDALWLLALAWPGSGDEAIGAARSEVPALLRALTAILDAHPTIDALNDQHQMMLTLAAFLDQTSDTKLVAPFGEAVAKLGFGIEELAQRWSEIPYPFPHALAGMTVGRYVLPEPPDPGQPRDVHDKAFGALSAAYDLYVRLLARLSHHAETLEQRLGLEPLPLPEADALEA